MDVICSESNLCNGNHTMLKSVKGNDYSGFQTEVLLIKICSDIKYDNKMDFSTHLLYKEYAGYSAFIETKYYIDKHLTDIPLPL